MHSILFAYTTSNTLFTSAGLVSSPADQAAVLEAINILKDSCKYSNLFHADTLKVLEGFAAANPAVFKVRKRALFAGTF